MGPSVSSTNIPTPELARVASSSGPQVPLDQTIYKYTNAESKSYPMPDILYPAKSQTLYNILKLSRVAS